MQLEEQREKLVTIIEKRQKASKNHFDQKVTLKEFVKDQYVLFWKKYKENPSMHTKFEALWIDPYQTEKVIGFNSYITQGFGWNYS